mmetsp:Transcript_2900/g.10521  ORF Transcript_2900/g.10521 Transcript_2900/m.10521 type:complete len:85 (+) Transcript_2900:67-321(+)
MGYLEDETTEDDEHRTEDWEALGDAVDEWGVSVDEVALGGTSAAVSAAGIVLTFGKVWKSGDCACEATETAETTVGTAEGSCAF